MKLVYLEERKVWEADSKEELPLLRDEKEKLAELREENSMKVISLEEKKLFEVSHILKRCEADLKVSEGMVQKNLDGFSVKEKDYMLKIEKLSSELLGVNSFYNQLLGKVEVLESLGKKK